MDAMIYSWWMPMNLSGIAIFNIKGADYCCILAELTRVRLQK